MFWLNVIGLILAFIGSIILAVALIKSKSTISKLSETRYGANSDLQKAFIKDRLAGIWGVGFLIIGFLLQLLSHFINL